jgi:hypothetical protein
MGAVTVPIVDAGRWWIPAEAAVVSAPLPGTAGRVRVVDAVFDADAMARLAARVDELVAGSLVEPAGLDGRRGNGESLRAHVHAPDAAALLWERIEGHLGDLARRGDRVACGINPRFRVIRYRDGGALVTHVDGSYRDPDGTVSLASVVVTVTEATEGGATRFVATPTPVTADGDPVDDPFTFDWDRPASRREVYASTRPPAGSLAVFDHGLFHDGEPAAGAKCVLRTDVMYRVAP